MRSIANNAASNAQKRVNRRLADREDAWTACRQDLLPDVTDLVSDQVNKLGSKRR